MNEPKIKYVLHAPVKWTKSRVAVFSNRVFTLTSVAIVLPLMLMFLLAFTPGISMIEDLGRHLLLGRIILEQGSVPGTNLLTHTCPEFSFVNHHWLSEVLFYVLERSAGLNGLILLKALALVLALALALLTLRPVCGQGIFLFTGALCAIALGYRAHIRPELFSYLGIALYGWLLPRIDAARGRPRIVRWAALLLYGWFWSNAHIYFVFGAGMVGAYVLACWITAMARGAGWHRCVPVMPTACLAALCVLSCINPNGWSGFIYPFRIFSNYGVGITENVTPLELWRDVLNPALLVLPLLSGIAFCSGLIVLRRGRSLTAAQMARLFITTAALIAAWSMARSIPLLALAVPPLLADACAPRRAKAQGTRGLYADRPVYAFAVIVHLLLITGVLTGSYHRPWPSPLGPTPFGLDSKKNYMALRRLQTQGLSGPVFNDYNFGSLVEYNLYPEPAYVDNRPEAFPETFWQEEYLPVLNNLTDWQRMLKKRNIQTIAVSLTGMKEPFIRLMMHAPDWQLVHIDFLCAVWVKKSKQNKRILENATYTYEKLDAYIENIAHRLSRLDRKPFWRRQVEADRIVYELYSLICLDRKDAAWPLVLQLHTRYPDYQVVHELMYTCAPPDAYPALKELSRKQARWPLSAKQVLDYIQQTDNEKDACKAAKRGLIFFPFNETLRQLARKI